MSNHWSDVLFTEHTSLANRLELGGLPDYYTGEDALQDGLVDILEGNLDELLDVTTDLMYHKGLQFAIDAIRRERGRLKGADTSRVFISIEDFLIGNRDLDSKSNLLVSQILDRLSKEERTLLFLYFFERWKLDEIGIMYDGVAAKTIHMWIQDALASARKILYDTDQT